MKSQDGHTQYQHLCKNEFRPLFDYANCYVKYSNDLYDIDTRLINLAYMKLANNCVHSIKNYLRMSKWCVSFFAGYIYSVPIIRWHVLVGRAEDR